MSLEAARTRSSPAPCAAPGCEAPSRGRHGRFCSDACRAEAWRQQRLPFVPEALPLPQIATPSPEERPRLQRACWRILRRLEQGRATNMDLLQVGGLRFGARLKELRDADYDVRTVEVDKATGRAVYEWIR